MTGYTANEAGKRLKKILKDVATTHQPMYIYDKELSAVILSEADWRSLQETIALNAVPGMRKSIINGLKTPVKKCSKKLPW